MNIEHLETLSCLKLTKEHQKQIFTSLEGVFSMMKSLENIEVIDVPHEELQLTQFRQDHKKDNNTFIEKKESVLGLHMENGYFLAPKVIKK